MSLSGRQITAKLPFIYAQIAEWEKKNLKQTLDDTTATATVTGDRRDGKDVIVAFRTRPPLDIEFEKFAGEVAQLPRDDGEEERAAGGDITEEGLKEGFRSGITVGKEEPGRVVAHNPGMKWNGPTLTQKRFDGDLAFGPSVSNEDVYRKTVLAHDMLNLVLGGGVGCVMAYGQTGTGKTYTMESLEHFVARDLFICAGKFASEFTSGQSQFDEVFEFHVTFLELLGKQARDMVGVGDDDLSFKAVDIHEDKAGFVRPVLVETRVSNSKELEEIIVSSLAHRRVEKTARNATSSRSHAVLTIRVHNKLLPFADDGELLLIDLAGSERYDDSKAHSKELMEQSRENNKSLSALKDCVRARAKAAAEDGVVHIPFRSNKLTLLLKSIFDLESRRLSKTVVIAHVSPHLQDIAHSISTLSYASPFLVNVPKPRGEPKFDELDPRTWDHDYTIKWLTKELETLGRRRLRAAHAVKRRDAKAAGKKLAPFDESTPVALAFNPEKLCPAGATGKNLARMYNAEWMAGCIAGANRDMRIERVKDVAGDVYGTFTVMLLKARTRTRNTVLRSRNVMDRNTWGVAPVTIDTETLVQAQSLGSLTQSQFMTFERERGTELQDALHAAIDKAKSKGEDVKAARAGVLYTHIEAYLQKTRDDHADELGEGERRARRKAELYGGDPDEAAAAERTRLMDLWLSQKETVMLTDEETE